MVTYLVSLDILTQSHSLSALSRELGVQPSPGSFDKGTLRTYGREKGTPHEHTRLRFESAAPETAPLEEHFESIFSRLAIDLLKSPALLTSDWEIWFTIGMMFSIEEIVFPELVIPPQCVHMLDGTRVGIDIIFYPSLILPALRASADAFLEDLVGGRVGAAYARTSTGFRAGQGLEEFRAFVDRYPALKVHTSRSFTFVNVFQQPGGAVGTVKMTILSPNSSLSFTLVFVQEEEEWRVDRFTVP